MRLVLVANRSEVGIGVFRAAAELGITTIGICPKQDRSLVQRLMDEAGFRLKDHGGPLGGAPGAIRGGTVT